jgi:signal transduction histidine kinase/CheY-like chemotaxis protein
VAAIQPVLDDVSINMNSVNKTDKSWNARFSSKRAVFFGMFFYFTFIMASLLTLIYFQVKAHMDIDVSLLQVALLKSAFILLGIGVIAAWFLALYYDRFRLSQVNARLKTQRLKAKIAEYSETDRALQEAKEVAEAANQAKSRYLSGISHELRSPLNSLLGYAQLLEKDNHLADKHRESVLIIRRSGEYLADLIEGLLDISKIEAGRLDILPSEVQFPALLDQIVSMFQLQADKKNIDFSYEFGSKLPEYVRVDEKHLRQILINLLSNAIKFTTEGSVRFTVDYRSETAIFTVEDTGRGIDLQDQERIFNPFEQVHNPDFTAVPGTGLGLTITRLLTEIMGGDISLTSELNKGSVFKVQLLMGSVREPTLIPVSQKDIEGYGGDRKLLMVVDDDPVHRQMMMNILEPIGFTVTEASNAMDCLEKTEQYLPDLFMLDVSMPGMNGLQLARALRDKNIRKPIIFISANVREGDAVSLLISIIYLKK